MSLWKNRIEESRKECEIKNDKSPVDAKEVTVANKNIDWEERHFQICLALISRADLTSLHTNTVSTREISPIKIIKTADKMVEALKQHLINGEEKSES